MNVLILKYFYFKGLVFDPEKDFLFKKKQPQKGEMNSKINHRKHIERY